MFDKKKLKLGFIIIGIVMIICLISLYTPAALSKYEVTATSDANVNLAIYLLKEDYYTEAIQLADMIPRSEPYIYEFKISNNYNGERTDTDLEYDLYLRTTTNMPLTYHLYKNHDTSNDIIQSSVVSRDDVPDGSSLLGAYFRKITAPTEEFSYTVNQENIYTLYVYFTENYNSIEYSNLIEYIEINVNSRQLLEEETD